MDQVQLPTRPGSFWGSAGGSILASADASPTRKPLGRLKPGRIGRKDAVFENRRHFSEFITGTRDPERPYLRGARMRTPEGYAAFSPVNPAEDGST